MARVTHFEITADDVARAKKFYETMFGWKIDSANMPGVDYWLAKTGEGEGIDGAIMPRAYQSQPIINTVQVDNIDESIAKVKSSGGELVGEKQNIPGVGYFHYVKDTEGNLLGMMQPTS